MFGVFCGQIPGDEVLVTGEYAVITFHSDYSLQRRGFLLSLAFIPLGMYRKMLFDSNGKDQLFSFFFGKWLRNLAKFFVICILGVDHAKNLAKYKRWISVCAHIN